MFASERQQLIIGTARKQGSVDVAKLADEYEVTTETIRRDLTKLEQMGLLRRVHGGAIPVERMQVVPTVEERAASRAAEKRAIAIAALAELPLQGAVLIDSGTTTSRLADIFPEDREITVITNALPTSEALLTKPRLTVFQLGGRIRRHTIATVETWALQALAEVRVDVAFLGSYGVSATQGLTTPDPSEGAVKRAMAETARRVVVLADHTKIGAEHMSIWASISDIDLLITDREAPAKSVGELTRAGLEVRLAGGDGNGAVPSEEVAATHLIEN
jgi:DeoR family transcriptional regulator, fructose operon transcriptional repressor